MGKSEILMLIAGVALSVMLAMVVVPMFSSGKDMADKQQVQQELLAIKSAIPLIKALEDSGDGNIKEENFVTHMEGFELVTTGTPADGIIGKSHNPLATFKITDDATNKKVTVTVTPTTGSDIKLNELSKLESICDGDEGATDGLVVKSATSLKCYMKR